MSLIQDYFVGYLKKPYTHLSTRHTTSPMTMTQVFWASIFITETSAWDNEEVTAAVDSGLFFLKRIDSNPMGITLGAAIYEEIAYDALLAYYMDDPQGQQDLNKALQSIGEDFEKRTAALLLHNLSSVACVAESNIFAKAAEQDESLYFYRFEVRRFIKEAGSDQGMLENLIENRATRYGIAPADNTGGPDKVFFLEKIPLNEIKCPGKSPSDVAALHSQLPRFRIVFVQDKGGESTFSSAEKQLRALQSVTLNHGKTSNQRENSPCLTLEILNLIALEYGWNKERLWFLSVGERGKTCWKIPAPRTNSPHSSWAMKS